MYELREMRQSLPEESLDNYKIKSEGNMNVSSILSKITILAGVAAISIAVASSNKDTTAKCVKDTTKTCVHPANPSACKNHALAGCAKHSAANDSSVQKKMPVAPNKEILFFMNPNGHPCQMQNAILDGIKDSLAGLATIKFYKTTEDADRDAFGKYGIRGLPTLVIADSKGNEISRFTPGIQEKTTILNTLHSLKSK
jgi:thioredoxin 1